MMSKTVSVTVGAVAAQLLSAGLWAMMGTPASRASWSWECTYYTSAGSVSPVYMAVNATTGPTCEDGSKLSCSCAATPCEGAVAALVNDLSCAGGGKDKAAGSCMMLHKTYGITPAALPAVAGRGMGNLTDACNTSDIIKVYGNKDGLNTMVSWGIFVEERVDSSVAPANASACQALCAADSSVGNSLGRPVCQYFTFLDQSLMSDSSYGYFRGLCFLHASTTCTGSEVFYSDFHGAISGPSVCPLITQDSGLLPGSTSIASTTQDSGLLPGSTSPAMPLPLTFAAAIIASTGLLSLA